ncbi:hypothetical protein ACFW4K_16035 [Nocardiopsis alba]|uniref:hypothetical protein n=1 Tax=Nocardiopsis alba TaxID=53437 RepID=UPI00366C2777
MTDRTSEGQRSMRVLGASKDRPRFLQVFDELRRRPSRSRDRTLRRMASRATRRLVPEHGALQRGDLAEPPPVLDLVLDRASDRARVRSMLVESCAVGPVWTLPVGDPTADPGAEEEQGHTETPSRPRSVRLPSRRRPRLLARWSRPEPDEVVRPAPTPPSGRKEDSEADVTTDELYELIGRLVDGGFAWTRSTEGRKELVPPRRRRPPPYPRMPRLRSLLWLHRCGLGSNEDDGARGGPDGRLENDSRSQIEVIGRLREARLEAAIEQRDRALEEASSVGDDGRGQRWTTLYKRALVHWRRAAWSATAVSRWVTRVSEKATFGLLDEKLLTPLSFLVSLIVAATPFAFLGLAAQQLKDVVQRFNDLVSLASGLLLAVMYLLTVFFFFLPWRSYLWLGDYRSTLNEGARKSSDGADTDRLVRPRSLGVHLFNELHHPDRDTGRLGGGEREKKTLPPPAHRIAVSALLDDLHRLYRASSFWRVGARDARPVLIYDQRELGPVGRYLVRLIEDERLRRALPDPLLLVQIRDGERPPLVPEGVESARYGHLPEYDGSAKTPREVRAWLRDRHLAGTLGVSRILTTKVAPLTRETRERRWHTPPSWVPTRSAWATRALGGCAVAVALVIFAQEVVNPLQADMGFCVGEGVTKPQGIFRVDQNPDGPGAGEGTKECVGVTYGDVTFDERLSGVIELIRDENKEVDKIGSPYVTIAHMAEMSTSVAGDPALAGVQGELLGMLRQQRRHNRADSGLPKIKLLLGNAGEGWAHAEITAEEIVRRAEDERSGMDRPIAAVGFGQSVAPNSAAIDKLGRASITMIGTTATFDGVSRYEGEEPSRFYFPVAPANSRIAEQAAYWARYGVSWTAPDESEWELPDHESAVAIASDSPEEGKSEEGDARNKGREGSKHEQYGPDLAERFMGSFRALGGTPWEGSGKFDAPGRPGVLLYEDKGKESLASLKELVNELCDSKEPPDLVYYAGRSVDFGRFYEQFAQTGGTACTQGEMTILGGDDISKYVSDEGDEIERNAERHQVFYTPLAPSGAWGGADMGFYSDIDQYKKEAEEKQKEDEGPSISHAALGNDALNVLVHALKSVEPPEEVSRGRGLLQDLGLVRPPYLGTRKDYEDKRDKLYAQVERTGLSGVSGRIEFGEEGDGRWYGERRIQLVLVGPLLYNETTESVQRQHVMWTCGRSDTSSGPTEQCLPVDAPRE